MNLETYRMAGDPRADDLAQAVLASDGRLAHVGRRGYNEFLSALDNALSVDHPVPDPDVVRRHLSTFPDELTDFFLPDVAPPRADRRALAQAEYLWERNQIAVLGVLYARSLPACYLIKNGIPALYRTARLREPRFIFQRVYETGLFLDSVMSPSGLVLLDDGPPRSGEPKRIWGRGFVEARKVRLLHASMRLMLLHPDRVRALGDAERPESVREGLSHRRKPWDMASLGVPINQLDMAYTLLTFGYLIPEGLARWGNAWDPDERRSFLHLWAVVGHVIGVDPRLVPTSLAAAAAMYCELLSAGAAKSAEGRKLTDALVAVLEEYLPPALGLRRQIPRLLIERPLRPKHRLMLFGPERPSVKRFMANVLLTTSLHVVRIYFRARNSVMARLPMVSWLVGEVSSRAGDAWIETWRDAYDRTPFSLPGQNAGWRRAIGYDAEHAERLRKWRDRFFWLLLGGLLFIVISVPLAATGVVMIAVMNSERGLALLAWTALSLGSGVAVLRAVLPWLSRRRPRAEGRSL